MLASVELELLLGGEVGGREAGLYNVVRGAF